MIPEPTTTTSFRFSKSKGKDCQEANTSAAPAHSEEDSGNENRQRSQRRSRSVLKGSENGECRSSKVKHKSKARGSHGKQRRVEAVTLFEVVSMGRSAMQMVMDDWIEAYAMDRDMPLLDLINFFIQCCGCRGVVTAELCQHKEQGDDIMSKMVEDLDEVAGLQYKKLLAFPWILTVTWPIDTDGVEYPLTQSGPYGRWFHSEFCDFISMLVAQCQHSVLFDSYMMNALMSLLTELSDSHIRAFRHTCTLAALKLVSALVGVALSLLVSIENSQKLYDVQKTKTTRQKSPLQLEKIQRKITELQEKRTDVEGMMDVLFKGIFLKRYRDGLPEVRSICMEELGLWMKLYSSAFLNDGYLKYMGWMMYDKVPDVRLKCVLSLQALYGDPLLLPKLDLFTSRFKDRMISMTLDKDNEVAVQTMKLLILISKSSDDVLTPEDYKQLFQFVYSSQRPLAATAGELVFSRVLSTGPCSTVSHDEMSDEDICKHQTYARLKALLQFYQESELHNHVVYLVDSLWDCGAALLKDWPAFTSLLLQDISHSSGLTQAQQAVLVEVLVASVRQASEGPVLAGRTGAKKVMSAREKKLQTDDCTKLTHHLLLMLPQLLSKFSSICDIVASLMRIPQYFLPECIDTQNTQAVSTLVAEMATVLELHSSSEVLEAAARTFLSLCEEGAAWCSVAQDTRDSLIQRWVEQLTLLLRDSLVGDCFSADEEKTAEILATMKKLRAFQNCHDLRQWNLFDLLSPVLAVESSQGGAPPQVLLEVLQCLSYSILWSLNTSCQTLSSSEKPADQRRRLRLFCECSHRCLSHADLSVRQQAFLGVCDVLTAHSCQLHVCDRASSSLALYTPSPKLQRALLAFVCLHVFVGADCDSHSVGERSEVERLEDLHRRRNVLAAYCKLIIHGVLEMSLAAEVFMQYVKHYNNFGDIIKETIYRSRQVDKMESAAALVVCLQQLFTRLKQEQEGGGPQGGAQEVQTFSGIRELARRFALTFADLIKFREGVVMIHWNGIEFVFQEFSQTAEVPVPPYLSYLSILSEFSCKLLKPDKRTVFSYLQKHTAGFTVDLRRERWQPLVHYRSSLLAVADLEDAASCSGSDRRQLAASRHPSKQKSEESPETSTPADPKACKGHRSSLAHSHQRKTSDPDPLPLATEPPAKRANTGAPVLGAEEPEDDTVEIEV